MNCVHCQVPLPDGARFCAACGTPQPEPKPQNRCVKCGAELPQGGVFCNKCGANQAQQAPAAPAPSFCRTCGNPLAPGILFCNKCGTPVGAAPQKSGLSPAAKKGIFIGGGALVAVIALVVILVVVLSGGVHSSPESVAEAYMEATVEGDYSAMAECMPAAVIRADLISSGAYTSSELEDKSRDELLDLLQSLADDPESDYYGRSPDTGIGIEIVSVEVTDRSKDDSDLERIRGTVKSYGFTDEEAESVTASATVRVTYRFDGADEYSEYLGELAEMLSRQTERFTCVEMDGDWYVLD